MAKSQIFVSYAHEDADWKDRVLAPLRALERNGHFHIWADSRLEAGDEWEREIETAIEHSDAAVLLISNAFLGSEFINGKEIPRILKQRKADGMRVFPLILKPCPWEDISWLNSLQVRPEKARPLVRASQWDAEQDLADFAREVLRKLKAIEIRAEPPESSRRAPSKAPPTRRKPSGVTERGRAARSRIAVVSLDSGLRGLNRWLDGLTTVQSMFLFERRSMGPPARSIGHVEGEMQLKVYRLTDDFQQAMIVSGDKAVVGVTRETLAFEKGEDIFYNHLAAPSSMDERIGFLSVANLAARAKAAGVTKRAAFAYTLTSHLTWQLGNLEFHEDTVGCPMDYTEDHDDIVHGLRDGRFCADCEAEFGKQDKKPLLDALRAMLSYGRR